MASKDSFGAKGSLDVGGTSYEIFRLDAVAGDGLDVASLPYSLKVLLENLLRTEDGADITEDDIRALAGWDADADPDKEIQFTPARVIMQDFTGVPCVVDLATMREAMAELGGDPTQDQPARPCRAGHRPLRHRRRLRHARGLRAQRRDRVRAQPRALPVPALGPGRVRRLQGRARRAPASSTRSTSSTWPASSSPARSTASSRPTPTPASAPTRHTTMVNGIGVVGWGVGGIEAEAAMLGQPVSMLIPRVVGFKLSGDLPEGSTATDLVLTITEMLRKHGVVGKFVEFYGPGVSVAPAGQPRHDRQHEPGVRLHDRGLPDRRGDHQVPQAHRSQRGAARAGRGLRQGAGALARPRRRAALLREARARPGHRGALARRAQAAAGPGLADRRQGLVPGGADRLRRQRHADER